jgi:hypothetical protein
MAVYQGAGDRNYPGLKRQSKNREPGFDFIEAEEALAHAEAAPHRLPFSPILPVAISASQVALPCSAAWHLKTLPVSRSISQTVSSLELSIPTNLVPTAVISVDSRIAAAMIAAPTNIGNDVPERSDEIARYP